jgi:NADP-dependent 3-hydroxy acid dehydrogenase YdfG
MSTSEHKVILLTGASRGIGLAIAKYLLKVSHKLVLVARSEEPLQNLKAEYPGQVEYLAADLADFAVSYVCFGGWCILLVLSCFSRVCNQIKPTRMVAE